MRGDAHPVLAAALLGGRAAGLGPARRPRRSSARTRRAGGRSSRRSDERASSRWRASWTAWTASAAGAPRAAALRHRARRVAAARPKTGDPFNDGRTGTAAVGLDAEVGRHEQHDAGRDREPRLRPGRGGPGRREPDGVRDVLRREAPVLHRGLAGVQPVRPQRRQRLHGVQPHEPDAVLLAPHRPHAAGRGAGRVRRPAVGDDHPRRGEADRQDEPRVDRELHRRRHRRGSSPTRRPDGAREPRRGGAAHQLPGGARAPRRRTARRVRHAGHRRQPRTWTTRRSPRSCPDSAVVARRRRPLLLRRQARLRRHRQLLGQPRGRVRRRRSRGCSGRRRATTSGPTRRTSRSTPTATSLSGWSLQTDFNRNSGEHPAQRVVLGGEPRVRGERRSATRPARTGRAGTGAGAAEADAGHGSAAAAASSSRNGTRGTSRATRWATATSPSSPPRCATTGRST